MQKAVQKRTLETRSRLLAAAAELVAAQGFSGLRTEEVVKRAGVAKGTFFAHFPDKESLMDHLIGAQLGDYLDAMAVGPAPVTPESLVDALLPMLDFMTCERYLFDVVLRRSGAAAVEEIGPIAETFARFIDIVTGWAARGRFRTDVPPEVLAEGVQAFAIQAMALNFCARYNTMPLRTRLLPYLDAWLCPATQR